MIKADRYDVHTLTTLPCVDSCKDRVCVMKATRGDVCSILILLKSYFRNG